MPSTLTHLIYHIIFSTKNRQPIITNEIRQDLYQFLGGIVKKEGGIPIKIGGMPDHMHMVVKLKPIHTLSAIVQLVKGRSSKWINEQDRLAVVFRWQEGYGAFTVSESQVPFVVRYVQNQVEHHGNSSFEEEFVRMLECHGVDYDERYVWD
jgi:putative transposase